MKTQISKKRAVFGADSQGIDHDREKPRPLSQSKNKYKSKHRSV